MRFLVVCNLHKATDEQEARAREVLEGFGLSNTAAATAGKVITLPSGAHYGDTNIGTADELRDALKTILSGEGIPLRRLAVVALPEGADYQITEWTPVDAPPSPAPR